MLATESKIGTTVDRQETASFLANGGFVSVGDEVWIGFGPSHRRRAAEPGRLSLYAPTFFLSDDAPWIVYDRCAKVNASELLDRLEESAEEVARLQWEASPFEAFEQSFEDIQLRIAEGSLVKAVPFIERRARAEFHAGNRASILAHALRSSQDHPLHVYGFWNELGDGLVGTTPETLFEERPGLPSPSLFTMALAGTRAPGAGSLLNDPKEVVEHRIVVEGIVERLKPLGEIAIGQTGELQLPSLVHLHTPIEVFPDRRVAFDEWVAALHPTPAIGAWPKEAGWRWLMQQPNASERDRYGAPFGFVPPDAKTGTCLVAIRNVQWTAGEAKLLAGCGIVSASQVDREWRELNAKLDAIQGALGL